MSVKKVRVGQVYCFIPVPMDAAANHLKHVEPGLFVKVINLHGCPPANTMGHCYVESLPGEFLGLVCTGSLQPLGRRIRETVRRQWGI